MTETGTTTVADAIRQLSQMRELDAAAHYLDAIRRTVLGGREELTAKLQGEGSTGTPVHPALVHLPIGGAFSAAVLDLAGLRAASGVVSAVSVAAAAPTALTGLADVGSITGTEDRRVAAAHYLAAMTGTALCLVSTVSRLGGSKGVARAALLGGCAAFSAAGALGGHLVYAK